MRGFAGPLSVVVTGGAGQLEGPAALCSKLGLRLAGLEVALRDLDDLAGNARRVVAAVDAAQADGALDEDVPVHVELPHVPSTGAWTAAADVVAERGLSLKFRLGGADADAVPHPHALARWIGAALDRETPFKCTAGLHHAVRHTGYDGDAHGFLNVLLATRATLDGVSTGDVVTLLDERDGPTLAATAEAHGDALLRTRRWFTSFGSCSIEEPVADLRALGLVP